MTPSSRAFYGALVGAFGVLLLSPISRAYFTQGFGAIVPLANRSVSNSAIQPNASNYETLRLAESLAWAFAELNEGSQSPQRLKDAINTAENGARHDPDNGYWHQAIAVFQNAMGNDDAAFASLKTASFATNWNNYSVDLFEAKIKTELTPPELRQAWSLALMQNIKNSDSEMAIVACCRYFVRITTLSDTPKRLVLLQNARLIRDGSRSVVGSSMGLELMDAVATVPFDMSKFKRRPGEPVSPKALATARASLISDVSRFSKPQAEQVAESYRRSDAWTAFINVERAQSDLTKYTAVSVVTSCLPGALVSVGLIGMGVALLGLLLKQSAMARALLTPPWTQALSIVAGVAVYLSTRLPFPAIWATVSLASFGVRQDKMREGVPSGYGSAYYSSLAILAICFSMVLGLYFVSGSPAGRYLSQDIGLDNSLTGSEFVLLGLSGVILSMALVTGSVWGFLLHVPAERLASVSLTRFGAFVCFGCFAAGIILAPISIAVDKVVGEKIGKIFRNEPNFYLTQ